MYYFFGTLLSLYTELIRLPSPRLLRLITDIYPRPAPFIGKPFAGRGVGQAGGNPTGVAASFAQDFAGAGVDDPVAAGDLVAVQLEGAAHFGVGDKELPWGEQAAAAQGDLPVRLNIGEG